MRGAHGDGFQLYINKLRAKFDASLLNKVATEPFSCAPARDERSKTRPKARVFFAARSGISVCSSVYIGAASRPYTTGGGGRSVDPDPESSPSTGRSSRRCARVRTRP